MLLCRYVLIDSKAIPITDDRIPRLDNSRKSLMRNASSKYICKEIEYLEILSQSKARYFDQGRHHKIGQK
jgi:hypothetical protein